MKIKRYYQVLKGDDGECVRKGSKYSFFTGPKKLSYFLGSYYFRTDCYTKIVTNSNTSMPK